MTTTKKTTSSKATSSAAQRSTTAQQSTEGEAENIPGLAIARTVHYHPPQQRKGDPLLTHAAMVACVLDPKTGRCNLGVLDDQGTSRPVHDVAYSAEPKPDSWNWPPKV